MICMVFLILAVYAVGFACALNTLDGSFRNFILFTKFGNFTGQHCSTVCQFRRGVLSAHLLNDFRPLCGKGSHSLGQALAVVHDGLQRGKLVIMNKSVFCKNFLGVFPDALQFRAVDAEMLFLWQDAQLITVVQIQAVHLRFTKEHLEENLEDASILRGTISFRRILPGRVFPFIQPWSIQQVISAQSVIYGR